MKNRLDDGTFRILDMACLFLAMPVAWWARALLPGSDPVLPRIEYAPFLALTILMWFVAAWFFQVYVSFRTRSVWPDKVAPVPAPTGWVTVEPLMRKIVPVLNSSGQA